jgi:hypothetical protein
MTTADLTRVMRVRVTREAGVEAGTVTDWTHGPDYPRSSSTWTTARGLGASARHPSANPRPHVVRGGFTAETGVSRCAFPPAV